MTDMSQAILPPGLLEEIRLIYPVAALSEFLEPVTAGYLSRNFILQTPEQKLFLKEYNVSDGQRVQEIHKAKFFFAERGIPVILPYAHCLGTTFLEYHKHWYALFPFVIGRTVPRVIRPPKCYATIGAMLGRIHAAGREEHSEVTKQEQKSWDRQAFLEKAFMIEKIVRERPERTEYDELTLACLALKTRLVQDNQIEPTNLLIQNNHLIHGDYHSRNIFYNEDDEISAVFDFEKTCSGARAFEIARSMDFICFSNTFEPKNFQDAALFLQAYNAVYPLPKDELKQGILKYYLNRIHSLWHESEHYLLKNNRVDGMYNSEYTMIQWYSKHLPEFLEKLTSLY